MGASVYNFKHHEVEDTYVGKMHEKNLGGIKCLNTKNS